MIRDVLVIHLASRPVNKHVSDGVKTFMCNDVFFPVVQEEEVVSAGRRHVQPVCLAGVSGPTVTS